MSSVLVEDKQNKLEDSEDRKKIEVELKRNFMVEAGAGSGKTTALVQRMVNQIISGNFNVEDIVAITFTKKAAEELKNRFHIKLEEKYKVLKKGYCKGQNITEEDLNKYIENIEIALDNIDKCYMGTIHSFCSKLLRERPIEANVSPVFTEMDELEEDEFQTECWREFLKSEYKKNDNENDIKSIQSYFDKIRERDCKQDISIDDLIYIYKELCQYDGIEIVYKKFNNDDEIIKFYQEPINNKCDDFIRVAKVINKKYIPDEDELKLYSKNKYYKWEESIKDGLLSLENTEILADKIKVIDRITKPINPQNTYRGNEAENKELKGLVDKLKNIKTEINKDYKKYEKDIELKKNEYYAYDKSIRFIKKSVEYYNMRKQQECKLGFQDLLVKTRNLLRDNSEARMYLGNKYKYILVDEFQDTDPIQAEIVIFLTCIEEDKDKKNWTEVGIKEGSLFIVGDPKQSIYRFRNADINIYNEVKEIIQKNEPKNETIHDDKGILKLTTNFRTVEHVCEWFNEKFKDLLQKDDYQAGFENMDYTKKLKNGSKENQISKLIINSTQIDNLNSDEDNFEKNNRIAAKKIANYIKQNIDNKKYITIQKEEDTENEEDKKYIEYKDFMILTKGKKDVQIYIEELENLGIPCIGTGEFTLGNNYTIKSFINLLKFINDERDKISYIGALKGCFGVSDQMLLDEYKSNNYFNLRYKEDENDNENDDKNLIKKANKKILSYIALKNTMNPIVLLEKIIEELNIIPWILSDTKNINGYKDLYNILEILKEDIESCYDFNDMVKKIDYICKTSIKEISKIDTKEINAVRVMNVHQSKGLEASIVILASPKLQPEKKRENEEKIYKHIEYTKTSSRGNFVIYRKNTVNPKNSKILLKPIGWEEIVKEAREYEDAEKIRLQYVAATRAKCKLIIVCNEKNDDNWIWTKLYDENIQELDVNNDCFEVDSEPKNNENIDESKKSTSELDEGIFNSEIKNWQNELKEKTYEFMIPTDYTAKNNKNAKREYNSSKKVEKDDTEIDNPKTAEWGTIVHKTFETLIKDEEYLEEYKEEKYLEKYMEYEIKNSKEYSEDFVKNFNDLKDEVNRFKNSSVYKSISDAKKNNRRVYSEVNFGVKVNDVNGLRSYLNEYTKEGCKDKDVCINGVIDLVIETEDGWHIVDYKTDMSNDYSKSAKKYECQLNIYKYVWQHLSKGDVSKVSLYFTRYGDEHRIDNKIDGNVSTTEKNIFDDLIAITEASVLWGTSVSTIKRFIREGKIINGVDCRNFGKQWVITKDAMNRVFGEVVEILQLKY